MIFFGIYFIPIIIGITCVLIAWRKASLTEKNINDYFLCNVGLSIIIVSILSLISFIL